MKTKFFLILTSIIVLLSVGCKPVSQLATFIKCDFDFISVSNVKVADINVNSIHKYSDFTLVDVAKLLKAFKDKNFILSLTVNVNAKNPNPKTATLAGFDYILWIDDIQVLTGSMDQKFVIEPNQSIDMPMNFDVDLLEVLRSESRDKILSFGCGLATNNADASRVKLSLKPYLKNDNKITKFPTYITIGGDKIMPSNLN
ncbi:MAG: LEA type 2 family protein [Bacteroidales bacterium]|nr:LEA type 2 family protein [Bacteroidales bacterium]